MPHEFHRSRKVEERWAPSLDAWLSRWGSVRDATEQEQWRGIDRVMTKSDGTVVAIEYKADEAADRTGNIFLETVSNDGSGRLGWVITTEADLILYLVAPFMLLLFRPSQFRAELPKWLRRYRIRAADNGRYRTLGVCVPIAKAREVADRIVFLEREAA